MKSIHTAGILVASLLVAACSAPNPGELLGGQPSARRGANPSGDAAGGGVGEEQVDPGVDTPADDGGTTATADAGPGTTGSVDAGPGVDAAIALGAFAGAPTFVSTTGASTLKGAHNFAANTPTTNPAGQACMTACHKAGGTAPAMVMGGTVFTTAAATAPAANVEIRLLGANGVARTAYTDANGNFFILGTAFSGNAKTGVRDAVAPHLMVAGVTAADCNSCHTGAAGATARIHL